MMQDFHLRKEKDKKEGKRSMNRAERYSLHAEGYGLQVRKKRVVAKRPTGTPSSLSAVQHLVTKKPAGMTSTSSAVQDPAAGAMIAEEPVDAEEVHEENGEEHEFLFCEECGYQDDTGFRGALCAI